MTPEELNSSVLAIVQEYQSRSSENDPGINSGLARLWGALRVANEVKLFIDQLPDIRGIEGVEITRVMSPEEASEWSRVLKSQLHQS